MSQTTIQYVLSRLQQLGITDIFGVPGDFAFPINDAICEDKNLRFIGSCNELNAAYAADGYARIKGMGAINTTYGPGELSALCGIAGSYAENVPIFHLTGQPTVATQRSRAVVHHTLGNGEFDLFYQMTAPAVCARTIITVENVEMKDMLTALLDRLPKRTDIKGPQPSQFGEPQGTGSDKITAEALYPRWGRFLKPQDILISETGTNAMGLAFAKMPKGATFHNQTLWGSIGWATPAAFGAALAVPHFVSGVRGYPFQSPFANPPGQGLSSSTVNVLWGFLNLVIGYLLIYRVGNFNLRSKAHAAALGLGMLLMSIMLAHVFGRFHGGSLS